MLFVFQEIISLLPKNILGSSVSGFGTPITSANSSISTHTPNLSSAAIGATVNANSIRPSATGVQQSVTPIRLQLTQPGQVAGFRCVHIFLIAVAIFINI